MKLNARNGSTPATYPTIYSYFTQQISKAALNRTATDPSYGTITYPNGLFAQGLVSGSPVSGSLLESMQQNALIAQKNGLDLSGYEGGPHGIYSGDGPGIISNSANNGAIEHIQFFMAGQSFDPGVVGDTTNTPPGVYAQVFSQWNSVNGRIPSQFNDSSPQSQYGPWGFLRYLPGDTTNIKYQAVLAQNALGPWVDPSPAPTWTVGRNVLDTAFTSGGTSLVCPLHVPSTSTIVVGTTYADAGPTISSVVIDGGIGAMTQKAFTVNAWSAAIHEKTSVPAGTYNATITFSTSANFATCYGLTLQGLASGTAASVSSGNPAKETTLAVAKGAFIIAVATIGGSAAPTFNTTSTVGVATGTVTQVNNSAAQASALAYWSPGPSFSSPIFKVGTNSANAMAAATYK